MLNFNEMREGKTTIGELCHNLTIKDLHALTDEITDTVLALIKEVTDEDVDFVPVDPAANDTFGVESERDLAWTLGHIIVHVTASSEESAALSSVLARGIVVEGRSRFETLWTGVHKIEELRQRLSESRRMRHAFLDTWPEQPHLDVTYIPYPSIGAVNAVSRFVLGIYHEESHLGQIREVVRQARDARQK